MFSNILKKRRGSLQQYRHIMKDTEEWGRTPANTPKQHCEEKLSQPQA
jgi:hypothetical protein